MGFYIFNVIGQLGNKKAKGFVKNGIIKDFISLVTLSFFGHLFSASNLLDDLANHSNWYDDTIITVLLLS